MKINSSSRHLFAAFSIFSLTLFAACTKNEAPQTTAPVTTPVATSSEGAANPAAATPAADASKKADVELTLSTDGDNLYFDKKELTAKPGQTVKITFKNASSPASAMNHNWVLTKPGVDQQVATDGMQAGEAKDWVNEGPNVVAHTKLAKPGETVSVTFTAPAAGDYPYVCTFPGHAMTMKGVLKIK